MIRIPISSKYVWPAILASASLLILYFCYLFALGVFTALEKDRGEAKLTLYQNIIKNELSRLDHLSSVLSNDPNVVKATDTIDLRDLNQNLYKVSKSARAEAIYLMNRNGLTIASSNYQQPQTFLGQNYGFRPYFQNAIKGNSASFFAIGATTSRPGYFLASPVRKENTIVGVLAVKLDLTALNDVLEATNDIVLITNSDGIIVLTSIPAFRYKTISPISLDRLKEIEAERQFGQETLDSLNWQYGENDTVSVSDEIYYFKQSALSNAKWNLIYLGTLSDARQRALSVATAIAILMALFALGFVFWRAQRIRRALATSQQDRKRLQREIKVRREAEAHLENAQLELKRTSKMAALGQLAASVTHELGQPISAMKNHIAAEEISSGKSSPILEQLSGIVKRMENITHQLRFFATSGNDISDIVDLSDVTKSALTLVHHDIKRENIQVIFSNLDTVYFVQGNKQRLEQVIINLFRNSIKAMSETQNKTMSISIIQDDNMITLIIEDTGCGLLGQSLEQIVEPFHTTGPSGEGMGLGLAISASIIHEHSGMLEARDKVDGGAIFEMTLPLVDQMPT